MTSPSSAPGLRTFTRVPPAPAPASTERTPWRNPTPESDRVYSTVESRAAAIEAARPAGEARMAARIKAARERGRENRLVKEAEKEAYRTALTALQGPGADVEPEIAERLRQLEIQEAARDRLAAKRAGSAPIVGLSFSELLDQPSPEPLVAGWLYRDSLFQVFGEPGCGKSFVVLDWMFAAGLGTSWIGGNAAAKTRSLYVYAEGSATTRDRAESYAKARGLSAAQLDEAVTFLALEATLVPESVGPLVDFVRDGGYGLVVFDTQSRFTAGINENDPSEMAKVVKALDMIRLASPGCAVGLVHHTGVTVTDRERGSNTVKAALDTQIHIEMTDKRLKKITARVVRDKAADQHPEVKLRLVAVPGTRSAVLELDGVTKPAIDPEQVAGLPAEVVSYNGPGSNLIVPLAQLFNFQVHGSWARWTRSDAAAQLGVSPKSGSLRRAWVALIGLYVITPTGSGGEGSEHVWNPVNVEIDSYTDV